MSVTVLRRLRRAHQTGVAALLERTAVKPESAVFAMATANTGSVAPTGGIFVTLGGSRLPPRDVEMEGISKNSFRNRRISL